METNQQRLQAIAVERVVVPPGLLSQPGEEPLQLLLLEPDRLASHQARKVHNAKVSWPCGDGSYSW